MAVKFYKCRHCGNVIIKVVDSKVPVVCCGEKMQELIPNTVDASNEKHVPVVTRINDCRIKVEVGSVPHPMLPEHMWKMKTEASVLISKTSRKQKYAHAQESLWPYMNTATCMASGRPNCRLLRQKDCKTLIPSDFRQTVFH